MTYDFNDNWTFTKEGAAPVSVRLPHDAMLTEKRRPNAAAGTNNGYFPGNAYLYEKHFTVDPADADRSFVLSFDGVYQNSTVSVNGAEAGGHHYGYAPFEVDITAFVHAGENLVSVRVDNSLTPNCRWYSGAGIYRPVQLLVRDKNYIKKLNISTVSVAPAVIAVDTDAAKVAIYDGDRLVAEGAPGEIAVPDAKLWTAETPHLYTCVAGSETDEKTVRFGIRELSWSASEGFCVNGKSIKFRGGCVHHDNGVLGACEYKESALRRVRILKDCGFNCLRMAHNPASQALLEACDEIGMYVMDEAFDGWYTTKTYHDYSRWFEKDWRKDLTALVESARNHPSVIMYSVGNEVTESAEERGIKLCARMRELVRGLDPTRPVTCGINVLMDVYAKRGIGIYGDKKPYKAEPLPENGKYKEKKTGSSFFNYWTEKLGGLFFAASKGKTAEYAARDIAESLDIVGLNYASSRYDKDAAKYPDRLMLGSETMSGDLPYNWARVEKYPQLLGDFVWAAWDYLGETCMGWTYLSYPGLPLVSGQGMIDITGLPLAQMEFMRVVWGERTEPYIGVRPLNHAHETPTTGAWQFTNALASWSWDGYEGKKATAEVYAAGDAVRLTLNGKEIGRKKLKDYKAIFTLPYAPGTLCAEVLDETGTLISSGVLESGGAETELRVMPEKSTVAPDEVFYVPVEFTDAKGLLKPSVEQSVELSAENAELLGFGSALTKTDELFDKPVHMSYRGRALAVFRAGREGNIQIKAVSAGVSDAFASVEIK